VAEYFDRHGVDALLAGSAPASDDLRVSKAVKRIGAKAPIALRLAAELIDQGSTRSIDEGLELELSHLEEIFATKDAYEGLSSLGKRPPVFTGT
jgi:enoyl-CoA hydratase/carnithine racemase